MRWPYDNGDKEIGLVTLVQCYDAAHLFWPIFLQTKK